MLSAASLPRLTPHKVKGTVVKEGSRTPVEKAYIVAVAGEEETLSASDGSFTLTTWQSLPAVIVIQHPDYRTEKVAVTDSGHTFLIRLQSK
jgi:hypothetical protein